jgi:predicted transcriptional regulator
MAKSGKWQEVKDRILWTIKVHTKDSPIGSKQLEVECDLSGSQLRDYIRELRREGQLIGSISMKEEKRGGYYYIHSWAEFDQTIKHLQNRVDSLLNTISKMKRKAKEVLDYEGQQAAQQQLSLLSTLDKTY